jgi:hypothetical protein
MDTFETRGKFRANLGHHSAIKTAEAGKSTHRRHTHMDIREEIGIGQHPLCGHLNSRPILMEQMLNFGENLAR